MQPPPGGASICVQEQVAGTPALGSICSENLQYYKTRDSSIYTRFVSLGFKLAEARSRKLGDCHHSATCGMQVSPWPAEGRGTDWEDRGIRHDFRLTSSVKRPRSGRVTDGPCSAYIQYLRAQLWARWNLEISWERCNFTVSRDSGWGWRA